MKRRSFLRHASHGIAIPSLLGAMGSHQASARSIQKFLNLSNETDKVLVLIFLEGGNDGLNTVVPLSSYDAMTQVRPHVILPENSIIPVEGTDFGFHPALTGFNSLYNEQRLQVIQSVGYPEQNLSHFRSTDIWMSASDADELVTSGWSGRYLEDLHPDFPIGYPNEDFPDPLAVELGHGSSLLFQGRAASMSMVLNNVSSFYELVDNQESETPDTLAGDKLRYIRLVAQQSQKYGDSVVNAAEKVTDQREYPDNRLAQQLKIVARLIAGELKTPIYMVSLGGFDTHDAQVENSDHTTGEHNELLQTLNDAVIAFMQDLEYLGIDDRVVGMTFSEFGRRIVSNASLGTDHGTSAPLFVFGNGVRGGTIGTTPIVTGNETYEVNLPMEHDFRQVYASVLGQWFETEDSMVNEAMLSEFNQLPIFGNAPIATAIENIPERSISLYPNPVRSSATLEFVAAPSHLDINLMDLGGRRLGSIYRQVHRGGKFTFSFDVSTLKAGRYIITIDAGGQKSFKHLIKV